MADLPTRASVAAALGLTTGGAGGNRTTGQGGGGAQGGGGRGLPQGRVGENLPIDIGEFIRGAFPTDQRALASFPKQAGRFVGFPTRDRPTDNSRRMLALVALLRNLQANKKAGGTGAAETPGTPKPTVARGGQVLT